MGGAPENIREILAFVKFLMFPGKTLKIQE